MMGLRRGFKTEANRTSREMRGDLHLSADDPLCPFATAEFLGVEVRKLSSYRSLLPDHTGHLMQTRTSIALSAMTVCCDTDRVIIYNDGLPITRSFADIMHEIAHMLLLHPPHRLCAESGGRHYDAELEEEANWLGPALLVSEEAALTVAQNGEAIEAGASRFGVSPQLMRMRLNVTGAIKRAARAA